MNYYKNSIGNIEPMLVNESNEYFFNDDNAEIMETENDPFVSIMKELSSNVDNYYSNIMRNNTLDWKRKAAKMYVSLIVSIISERLPEDFTIAEDNK